MTLASQLETDVDVVFLNTNDFATSITYHPRDGVAKSIDAVVRIDGEMEKEVDGTRELVSIGTMWVDTDDVTIDRTDRFTIDGNEWFVDDTELRIGDDRHGMGRFSIWRKTNIEKAPDGYRRGHN